MKEFASFRKSECELELQVEKERVRKMNIIYEEMKFAIQCCSKGGNTTADGSCSTEWQDRVSSFGLKTYR